MGPINILPKQKILGLKIINKKIFSCAKGAVFKHLSINDEEFSAFGEIYYSITHPKEIKGWKFHNKKSQNFVVISGSVKFVFFDNREGSSTKGNLATYTISPDQYAMISVPEKIWYSFKCLSKTEAIIANCTNLPHDSNECIEKNLHSPEFPNVWKKC